MTSTRIKRLAAAISAVEYGEKLVHDNKPFENGRELFQSDNEQVQKMLEDEMVGIEGPDHTDKREDELLKHPLYDDLKNLARYNIPSEYQTGIKPPGPSAEGMVASVHVIAHNLRRK